MIDAVACLAKVIRQNLECHELRLTQMRIRQAASGSIPESMLGLEFA